MFSHHQRFLKWVKTPATLAQTAAFLLLPTLAATAALLPPQTRHALTAHLPAIALPTLTRQVATSNDSPRARWIQTSAQPDSSAVPRIVSVSDNVVTGTLHAAPNAAFRLDFFASPDADSEQGQSYLGSANVTTNGSGDATFRFVSPVNLDGQFVSATATAQNGAVSAPSRAVSAPITNCSTVVTTNADAGAGSLRAAITCANSDADASTISFNIAGAGDKTIALASTLPTLANTLTIINGQPTTLTVSGGNAVLIFRTAPGANVTLKNLILSGGKATGSTQDAQRGGAIFNDNALLSVIDCNLSGNRADSQGGAIYALGSTGTAGVTLLRCTLSDNRVSGGAGGAIFTGSSGSGTVNLELTRCLFQSNSASTGGALFNGGGSALITESSLLANSAAGGGAITNDAFSTSTTVQLVRSTLAQNTAFGNGAAIQNRNDNGGETASLLVSNSTFSDNAVGNNSGQGGAIFNAAYFGPAQVTISDSTFARNSATNGASLYNEGSSATRKATMTLKNSIFQRGANTGMATVTANFYNQSAAGATNSANSTITSAGNNLSDDSNNFLIQSTDRQNRDPKLGPLQNNGGPTQTVALLAGSPAIDAGNTALTTDQRGIARPQGSADDIGAYEFAVAAPAKTNTTTTLGSTRNPSTAGQLVSIIITVRPTSGNGRAGGTVTLKDGATTVFSSPLAVDTMGNGATAYNASNLSPGTHSFTAIYSGDANNNGSTSAVLRQVVNADPSACSTVVTTNADAGAGSLRAAINCANSDPNASMVSFNIAGAGVKTIALDSALPDITTRVVINGYSQPGSSANTNAMGAINAVPLIQIVGNGGTGTNLKLVAGSGGSSVRGLILSGAGDSGIELGSPGNVVGGCFIGTNAAGLVAQGNSFAGVRVTDFSNDPGDAAPTGNSIGGTSAADRNLISGNGDNGGVQVSNGNSTQITGNLIGLAKSGAAALGNAGDGVSVEAFNCLVSANVLAGNGGSGVLIASSGTNAVTGNVVTGNRIGTNAAGTAAIANQNGVALNNASLTTIGGTAAGAGNLISGNTFDGITIFGGGTVAAPTGSDNVIQGNLIGLNAAGNAALGNGDDGVDINSSLRTQVGGTTASARNVMAASGDDGIEIDGGNDAASGADAVGNLIQGNFIGTDASGNNGGAAFGNSDKGISIENASANFIGASGAGNVIVANAGGGIAIFGTQGRNNLITGNRIGVAANGATPIPNTGGAGVTLDAGANGNRIGGEARADANIIANNVERGVLLTSQAGTGNAILGNSIYGNANLGIDLNTDGISRNDAGDGDGGANNTQNYPVLNAIAGQTISGTLNSVANANFRVEFFASPAADPTGYGEGQTFLGFVNVTTDSNGNTPLSFTAPASSPLSGQFIAATATRIAPAVSTGITVAGVLSDTSEFSQAIAAGGTVTKTNTATTLVSSRNPSQVGQNVTFTARVAAALGVATPTGTVTFRDGATTLGTVPLTGGVATFVTANFERGHTFDQSDLQRQRELQRQRIGDAQPNRQRAGADSIAFDCRRANKGRQRRHQNAGLYRHGDAQRFRRAD